MCGLLILINLWAICIFQTSSLAPAHFSGALPLKYKRKIQRSFACFALALAYLVGTVAVAAPQQQKAKPSPEKWRPRDGLYAEPGEKFLDQCNEYGDLVIDLSDKSVGGNEWGCKVNKLTDTTPGTVDLDLTCFNSEDEGKETTQIIVADAD